MKFRAAAITDPGDLRAPVEQRLGADVGAMLADVVEQAAERHQRCDEHHLGREADRQHVDAARMQNGSHDASFVE